jgi:hypothetical protein
MIHALSAAHVLYAWEAGQRKRPVDRALLLLSLTFPDVSPKALATLPVGQRNAWLLLLRLNTLGSEAMCFVECPRCGTPLEFVVDIEEMLPAHMANPGEVVEPAHTLTVDEVTLHYRLLTSMDLASIAGDQDLQVARLHLIERCVTQALWREQAVAVESLPERILRALADAVIEYDPLAEMTFALECFSCQHRWTVLFDIVSFFWAELHALARRLLRDVHTLASAYGWRESDILAMSALRRQAYRELVR